MFSVDPIRAIIMSGRIVIIVPPGGMDQILNILEQYMRGTSLLLLLQLFLLFFIVYDYYDFFVVVSILLFSHSLSLSLSVSLSYSASLSLCLYLSLSLTLPLSHPTSLVPINHPPLDPSEWTKDQENSNHHAHITFEGHAFDAILATTNTLNR